MKNDNVAVMYRPVAVEPGDTLSSLAEKYCGNAEAAKFLAKINGIAESAILSAGSKIKVPTSRKANLSGDDVQTMDEITVSAKLPFYLYKEFYFGVAAGAVLIYLFLGRKK